MCRNRSIHYTSLYHIVGIVPPDPLYPECTEPFNSLYIYVPNRAQTKLVCTGQRHSLTPHILHHCWGQTPGSPFLHHCVLFLVTPSPYWVQGPSLGHVQIFCSFCNTTDKRLLRTLAGTNYAERNGSGFPVEALVLSVK
jgi:hypothetical protein